MALHIFLGGLLCNVLAIIGAPSSNAYSLKDVKLPTWPIVNVGTAIPSATIGVWRKQGTLCGGPKSAFARFPAKFSGSNGQDTEAFDPDTLCDDGDMTLFNGLLCASGETVGCTAVAQAHDTGKPPTDFALTPGFPYRWYRSPHRKWMRYHRCFDQKNKLVDATFAGACAGGFSPDMSLGVMLYALQTHDVRSYENWLQYITDESKTTKLCILQGRNATQCTAAVWPRVCDYDMGYSDKPGLAILGKYGGQCALRPFDVMDFDATSSALAATVPKGFQDWDAQMRLTYSALLNVALGPFGVGGQIVGAIPPLIGMSATDATHFPLHLDAARVLIRMMIFDPSLKLDPVANLPGPNDANSLLGMLSSDDTDTLTVHTSALFIRSRQPWNPYYHLLAEGPTPETKTMILDRCPKQGDKPADNEWIWEIEGNNPESASSHSMGWDCVFVANLYNKMRQSASLFTTLIALFNKYGDTLSPMLVQAHHALAVAQSANDAAKKAVDAFTQTLVSAVQGLAAATQFVQVDYVRLNKQAVDAFNADSAQLAGYQAQDAKLKTQAGQLAAQAANMPDTIQRQIQNRICNALGPLKTLCKNVTSIMNIPNQAKAGVVNSMAQLNGQIANLETHTISGAQAKIAQDDQVIKSLGAQLAAAQGQMTSLQAKLATGALQAAKASADAQFAADGKILQTAQNADTRIQKAVDRAKGYVNIWTSTL